MAAGGGFIEGAVITLVGVIFKVAIENVEHGATEAATIGGRIRAQFRKQTYEFQEKNNLSGPFNLKKEALETKESIAKSLFEDKYDFAILLNKIYNFHYKEEKGDRIEHNDIHSLKAFLHDRNIKSLKTAGIHNKDYWKPIFMQIKGSPELVSQTQEYEGIKIEKLIFKSKEITVACNPKSENLDFFNLFTINDKNMSTSNKKSLRNFKGFDVKKTNKEKEDEMMYVYFPAPIFSFIKQYENSYLKNKENQVLMDYFIKSNFIRSSYYKSKQIIILSIYSNYNTKDEACIKVFFTKNAAQRSLLKSLYSKHICKEYGDETKDSIIERNQNNQEVKELPDIITDHKIKRSISKETEV